MQSVSSYSSKSQWTLLWRQLAIRFAASFLGGISLGFSSYYFLSLFAASGNINYQVTQGLVAIGLFAAAIVCTFAAKKWKGALVSMLGLSVVMAAFTQLIYLSL